MVVAVAFSTVGLFSIPAWLQGALVVGALGLSAVLSGWLPKHPRIQKYVTAVALAFVLAMSLSIAHRTAAVRQNVTIGWPPSCDGGWYYVDFTCWFSN